jgi:hypothetical protein
MRYALRRGVQVYLVTNRAASMKASTVENLARLQVPLGPRVRAVPRRARLGGDKSGRRQFVRADHRVLLMVGDDLGDFVSISDAVPAGPPSHRACSRARSVGPSSIASAGYWEDRWIVLPNPAYGSWSGRCTPRPRPTPNSSRSSSRRYGGFQVGESGRWQPAAGSDVEDLSEIILLRCPLTGYFNSLTSPLNVLK